MKQTLLASLLAGVFLANPAFNPVQAADKPVLTVYTYDSFVSEWGSGPKLEAAFEKNCNCDLKFIAVEDGVSILNRLRVEGDKAKADVILGIDDALLEETRAHLHVQNGALPICFGSRCAGRQSANQHYKESSHS